MELWKLGRQSNQRQTEDTNNSSRKEPALLISILHALKSCQLSLRQTAAAFHTILCTTENGPPLYTEQGGGMLWLTVLCCFLFLFSYYPIFKQNSGYSRCKVCTRLNNNGIMHPLLKDF